MMPNFNFFFFLNKGAKEDSGPSGELPLLSSELLFQRDSSSVRKKREYDTEDDQNDRYKRAVG